VDNQVGGSTIRRNRQQNQANGVHRRQAKEASHRKTQQRQQNHLAEQTNQHRFGLSENAPKIGHRQRHTECHHDDGNG